MKAIAVLFMAVFALQAPAPLDTTATIEGSVTLFGTAEPIAKVQITLYRVGGTGNPEPIVTDSNGHFKFTGVIPGSYDIAAQRGGYASPAQNGVRIPGSSQKTIMVGARQHADNVDFTLVRGGVITGRVLDANGKGIPRLHMEARSTGAGGSAVADFAAKTAESDDRGRYRIFDLDPGQYVVSAELRTFTTAYSTEPQGLWVKTYLPGVTAIAKGTPVDVRDGSVVAAPDFTIQSIAKFWISGIVATPPNVAAALSLNSIYLVPADADENLRERQNPPPVQNIASGAAIRGNRRFEIRAEAGTYDLFVEVGGPGEGGGAGRMRIRVDNQDVKDVVVTADSVSLKGQILMNGRTPGPVGSLRVILSPVDLPVFMRILTSASRERGPTVLDTAGFFAISGIPRGTWQLLLMNLPEDLAVADIRQGKTTISANAINVTDDNPELLQIILSPAGAIEGFVRDANQKPLAAMRVISYPFNQPPEEGAAATTDDSGHFLIKGLAPGQHAVFAFDPALLPAIPQYPAVDSKIKAVLDPYKSQSVIAKVNAGTPTTIELIPLKK